MKSAAHLPRMEHDTRHIVDMPPQRVHLPCLCVCSRDITLGADWLQLLHGNAAEIFLLQAALVGTRMAETDQIRGQECLPRLTVHAPQLDLPVICPRDNERKTGMESCPVDPSVVPL